MAEQTIYFSKITVDSVDVYDIQKDREKLYGICEKIFLSINNDVSFVRTGLYKDEDGNACEEKTTYSVNILSKKDNVIIGVMYKQSYLYAKSINEITKEITITPVENTEDIKFYYDVMKEYVGFYVRNRFGRKQFNSAFAELINEALKMSGEKLSVCVSTYSKGASLDELKEELSKMRDLKKLTLIFQPINPDEGIIDDMERGIEQGSATRELEESNASYRSIVYEAKGLGILNPNSKIIQSDLEIIDRMNGELKAEELTQRGYVKILTEDSTGSITTTSEREPYKKKINNESEFEYACRDGIIYLLRKGMK